MCLLTVRPERCSPPMTVYKGKWTPKTQAAINGHFPVGSEVAYSCLEGYRLVGAEMLKCTADRLWSKIPPICVPQSGRTYSCVCMHFKILPFVCCSQVGRVCNCLCGVHVWRRWTCIRVLLHFTYIQFTIDVCFYTSKCILGFSCSFWNSLSVHFTVLMLLLCSVMFSDLKCKTLAQDPVIFFKFL